MTQQEVQEVQDALAEAFSKKLTEALEDDGDDGDVDEEENGIVLGTLRLKDNKIILSETYYGLKNPVEITNFEDLKKLITMRLLKARK
jgi:hypothetical protein